MDKVNEKIGTDYKLFNYYGAPDAEHVIIAMGSVNDTIEETIDYLVAAGQKVGVVKVRLYRPFCAQASDRRYSGYALSRSPYLDRTKEPGALGEPLYLDVVAALKGTKFDQATDLHRPLRTWVPRIPLRLRSLLYTSNTEQEALHHRYRR